MGLEELGQHVKDISKDVAKGISTSLMQNSFEKMGQAFTDTGDVAKDARTADARLSPWREAGAKSAQALEMRWHKSEYDNFSKEQIAPWKEQKKSLLAEYKSLHALLDDRKYPAADGSIADIDVKTPAGQEQLLRYRTQIEKDFYARNADLDMGLAESARTNYPANPLVGFEIQSMMQTTANTLKAMTNPEQTLKSESDVANIMGGRAEISNLEADSAYKRAAAKVGEKEKKPTSVQDALAHPAIGYNGVVGWLLGTPEGQKLMTGKDGAGASARAEAEALLRAQETAKGTHPMQIEKMIKENSVQLMQLAAGAYLKSVDPMAAAAAEASTPWAFPGKAKKNPVGIINTRVPKELIDSNTEYWKTAAETKLHDLVASAEEPPTLENALSYINSDWLPKAIVGQTEDTTLDPSTMATTSKATEEYRSVILREVGDHLRKRWHRDELLARMYKEDVPKSVTARQSGGRRAGLFTQR